MLKQMRAHSPHFGTARCRGHRSESGGATGTRRDSVPPTRGQPRPVTRARSASGTARGRPVRTDRRAAGPPAPLPAPCRPAAPLPREGEGHAASLRVAFPDLASTVAEVGKPWPYAPRAAGTLRRGGAERRSTPGSQLWAARSVGLAGGGAAPFVAAAAPPPPAPARPGGGPGTGRARRSRRGAPSGSGGQRLVLSLGPGHRGRHRGNPEPLSAASAAALAAAFLFSGILENVTSLNMKIQEAGVVREAPSTSSLWLKHCQGLYCQF